MVAVRPLKAGEIILKDAPIILYSALPFQSDNHNNTTSYCSNCFICISQQSQIISCNNCKSQFCTVNCQSIASTTSHTSWTCQTLIRLQQYFSDNRLPLDVQIQARFLIAAYNIAFISQSKFQTLLSLQGSESDLDSDSEACASFLHSLISSVELGFTVDLVRVLLAKDKLNAFGIMEPFSEHREERSVRAYGIYPVVSFFNHDCLPNACRFDYIDVDGSCDITIRMIHDVQQGREICLSYFPVNLKYSERQKRLKDDYGFVCNCDRCKVEANWSESEEDGVDMNDDDGNDEEGEEETMDEDIGEEMEDEDGDVMKGDDEFPHAYFFLNYMCDRKNCWGTMAPLPTNSVVMECNVCGTFKKLDQV